MKELLGYIIAMVVGGIIVGGAISGFSTQSKSAKTSNVETFFTNGLTTAAANCYKNKGLATSSCDKAALIDAGDIKTNHQLTEWGETWTVAAATSTITITYPLDASGDADNIGPGLVTILNKSSSPVTTSYDATNDDLTVVYKF
jgi:hypothetical protein